MAPGKTSVGLRGIVKMPTTVILYLIFSTSINRHTVLYLCLVRNVQKVFVMYKKLDIVIKNQNGA